MSGRFRMILVYCAVSSALDEEALRVVQLFGSALTTNFDQENVVRVSDYKGGEWVCYLANERDGLEEEEEEIIKRYRAKWKKTACIVAPRRGGDYWGYEICPGVSGRQFRVIPATQARRRGMTPPNAQFSLGVYSSTEHYQKASRLEELFPQIFTNRKEGQFNDNLVSFPSFFQNKSVQDLGLIDSYREGDDGRSLTTYSICGAAETEYRLLSPSPAKVSERVRQQARADTKVYDTIRIAAVSESPKKQYHVLLASSHLCSKKQLLDLVLTREIKLLRGACIRKKSLGWWTYEVCVGVSVRQFRQGAAEASTTRTTKTDSKRRFLFGGNSAASIDKKGSPLDNGFTIGTFRNETAIFSQPDPSRGPPHIPDFLRPERYHIYDQGEICDITGARRSATVHFRCDRLAVAGPSKNLFFDTSKAPYITTITESSTCNYEIVVAIPAACAIEDTLNSGYYRDEESLLSPLSVSDLEASPFSSSALIRNINCFPLPSSENDSGDKQPILPRQTVAEAVTKKDEELTFSQQESNLGHASKSDHNEL